MSIESIAAVVGDNDGAAFITKAEFESLKNDFQTQINRYNSSLDNKIDGAIANYLSGVRVAKETDLKPPVSNYNEIWWIQQFLVKGKKRKWTDRTTYTTDSTWTWQPWIAEKRRSTRENQIDLAGFFGYWGAAVTFMIRLKNNGNSDHYSYGHQLSTASGDGNTYNYADYCIPVPYIRLQDKTDDLYLNNSDTAQHLNYEVSIENAASWGHIYDDNVHYIELNDGTHKSLWEVENSGAWAVSSDTTNGFKVLTPGSNDFMKFELTTYRNNARTTANLVKWTVSLPKKNLVATYPHQTWKVSNSMLQNIKNVWMSNSDTGIYKVDYQNPAYVTNGCSILWMSTANESLTNRYVNRMMYGYDQATDDKEDKTNVYRLNRDVSQGFMIKQIEEFSDFETFDWKVDQIAITNKPTLVPWTADTTRVLYPTNKNVDLSLPLLENVKIKRIRNTRFKYNKNTTSLRLGDGMPLVLDCPGQGTVEVEFKYTVNRIIDSVGSNKKITLDVKNANFFDTVNTNNADFYDGKINGTSKKLKGVEVDVSDGKVKMELENVKKEDNIWIRLAPKCNDGGYYVTLSDLKMKLVED